LRDTDPFGGPDKVLFLGDRDEVAEMGQLDHE
jgi:hypothetical protein